MTFFDFLLGTIIGTVVFGVLLLILHDPEHRVRSSFLALLFTNVFLPAIYWLVWYFGGGV